MPGPGALSPVSALNPTSSDLRDNFTTSNHHSVAARVSGKDPHDPARKFPQVTSGFPARRSPAWTQFGEAAYQMDPNLHLSIRQPLPGLNGRWEALADFSNLLSQGYVTVSGQDSRIDAWYRICGHSGVG